jgi:hypothetical protein
MVQGYDQSFSQAATFADNAPEQLMSAGAEGFAPMGELKTGGVRQIFEVKSNAKVLARYSHGEPATVQMPVGKGTIYYSGSLLEERSYGRLLEALFREAGVTRPVRIRTVGGGDAWNIEARFAPFGSRKLLYVVNYNSAPSRLNVEAAAGRISRLLDLRNGSDIRADEIIVPARQTAIYELF